MGEHRWEPYDHCPEFSDGRKAGYKCNEINNKIKWNVLCYRLEAVQSINQIVTHLGQCGDLWHPAK